MFGALGIDKVFNEHKFVIPTHTNFILFPSLSLLISSPRRVSVGASTEEFKIFSQKSFELYRSPSLLPPHVPVN